MWLHRILTLALTVTATGTLVSSSSVSSQPNLPTEKEPPQNQTPSSGQLMRDLDLSTEQINKIKQIRQKYHHQIVQITLPLRAAQQELTKMMTGNVSVETIRDKYEEVVFLKEQLNDLRFASMLEMREVLSLKQRTQLAQSMEQNRNRQHHRVRPTEPQRSERPPLFQFFNSNCPEKSKTTTKPTQPQQ